MRDGGLLELELAVVIYLPGPILPPKSNGRKVAFNALRKSLIYLMYLPINKMLYYLHKLRI